MGKTHNSSISNGAKTARYFWGSSVGDFDLLAEILEKIGNSLPVTGTHLTFPETNVCIIRWTLNRLILSYFDRIYYLKKQYYFKGVMFSKFSAGPRQPKGNSDISKKKKGTGRNGGFT